VTPLAIRVTAMSIRVTILAILATVHRSGHPLLPI
jgi:hypothetical protein